MQIARGYAGKFEQWGIDEAFLDVSDRVADFFEAEELARKIKLEIKEKEGLTGSIGVGPTSLSPRLPATTRSQTG